ncbi:MAG: molybdopterin-dependent oxidoreductase [Gemmatimonadetes bacterium]|nr:molybdopterin-dependent oxidoreductase [Gemmatimonadota bacterium]
MLKLVARVVTRFHASHGRFKRGVVRTGHAIYMAVPPPLRRHVAAGYIRVTLFLKRVTRVEEQTELTPVGDAGTLSFWGVPEVDVATFSLSVEGAVERPRSFDHEELMALPSVDELVRMDCVGGFRNNTYMRGVRLDTLFETVGPAPGARRAVFHCADDYFESITLDDLRRHDAFLAYSVNGSAVPHLGYPLRLAIPGKYGYKWPKWVTRIEIVSDVRMGYWPERGLPDRGNVGDRR